MFKLLSTVSVIMPPLNKMHNGGSDLPIHPHVLSLKLLNGFAQMQMTSETL